MAANFQPVSTCNNGKGGFDGKKAFIARCSMTPESLPMEYSITGLRNSATTSRRMAIASASSLFRCRDNTGCTPQPASGSGVSPPLATNQVLRNAGLPYRRGTAPGAQTPPPAASSTACPAAVSHSIVVPRRGYKSASPAAMRQNLSDEPTETRSRILYDDK